MYVIQLKLFYVFAAGGSTMPTMDKQRVEDLTRLIRGDVDFLPPDKPTAVRLVLAGTKHGNS